MKMVKWSVSFLIVMMSLVPIAWSHDYWIMPESFRLDGSGMIEAALDFHPILTDWVCP